MDTAEQQTLALIDQQVKNNPVILYMKGSPMFPQCGFSARACEILAEYNVPFAHVNVFEQPDIRRWLPKYADWPTFPQLFVNGELIGGCDIIVESHERGELAAILAEAQAASPQQ